MSNGDIHAKTPTTYRVDCKDYVVNAANNATINATNTAAVGAATTNIGGSGAVNITSAAIGMTATGGGSATMSGKFNMNGQFTQVGPNSFNGHSVDQHVHMVTAVGSNTQPPTG
jgi:phage gp45-like